MRTTVEDITFADVPRTRSEGFYGISIMHMELIPFLRVRASALTLHTCLHCSLGIDTKAGTFSHNPTNRPLGLIITL